MHDCFAVELTGDCLECSFRLTRGGPYLSGVVIGSTVGAYPRGKGSNPVEGNGHFFPSYRQLYFSSFSDTHTHTHTLYIYFFFKKEQRKKIIINSEELQKG